VIPLPVISHQITLCLFLEIVPLTLYFVRLFVTLISIIFILIRILNYNLLVGVVTAGPQVLLGGRRGVRPLHLDLVARNWSQDRVGCEQLPDEMRYRLVELAVRNLGRTYLLQVDHASPIERPGALVRLPEGRS
jgi:hypothetical protein